VRLRRKTSLGAKQQKNTKQTRGEEKRRTERNGTRERIAVRNARHIVGSLADWLDGLFALFFWRAHLERKEKTAIGLAAQESSGAGFTNFTKFLIRILLSFY
jgi:hypothetical protein